jgi:ribonuclease J
MAAGRHSDVQIQEGDTVVLSASPIPGNEALVYKVINSLFRAGARVLYDRLASVHVSGHAAREGIKLMCSLVKPNYAVPIHGEPRHSYLFKEMAVDELGFLPEEVMVVRPGQVLELEDGLVRFGEEIEARSLLVDGLEITAWNRSLFRERLALAEEGVIIISAVVDGQTGDPLVEVAVTGKGFSADEARASALLTELSANLSQIARDVAGKNYSSTTLQSRLVETARRFLTQTTGRRPVILPHVIEV